MREKCQETKEDEVTSIKMYLIMCALQHESYNEEPNITG
jgi:hypothetical protein